jgi:transposase
MPKAYTCDLRKRVILAVELGTSRREAAEHFNISASSAVKWLQCWRDNGTASPKPRGGSVSRLERYLKWILDLVAEQRPDAG